MALQHIGVLVPDLLPFKLLAAIYLLRRQQLVQIWQRDRLLALMVRAEDWQLLVFDAGREPGHDAINVVNVTTAEGTDVVEEGFRE